MDRSQSSITPWLVGLGVIIILALGWWWFWGGGQEGVASNSGNATTTSGTTSQNSTTTSETSGAERVEVQQRSANTVASLTASAMYGSTFNTLLNRVVGSAALANAGPYTVFVPTDGAFGRVTPGTIEAMSDAELRRLLQYHIVVGKALDVDEVNSGQVTALSEDPLNFQVDGDTGKVYVNSGYVLQAYRGSNGIVYVINSVLVPPAEENQ